MMRYCQDKGGAGGSALIGLNEPGIFINWEVIVHGEHTWADSALENATDVEEVAVA